MTSASVDFKIYPKHIPQIQTSSQAHHSYHSFGPRNIFQPNRAEFHTPPPHTHTLNMLVISALRQAGNSEELCCFKEFHTSLSVSSWE